MKPLARALAIAMLFALGTQAAWSQTLKAVKDRGELVCGANGTLAGFGMPDDVDDSLQEVVLIVLAAIRRASAQWPDCRIFHRH